MRLILAVAWIGTALAQPQYELTGRVLDSETRSGVVHARVTVNVCLDPNGYDAWHIEPVYVLTDAQGKFRVTGLPKSWCEVSCRKSGYRILNNDGEQGLIVRVGVAVQPMITLELTPETGISGLVLDEAGAPAGNAEVQVWRRMTINGRMQPAAVASAHTDVDGTFRIPDLYAGRFAISASTGPKPRFYPDSPDAEHANWFELKTGERRRFEFHLKASSSK